MRKINKFIGFDGDLNFGDIILFQEYEPISHDGTQHTYGISKPIYAIYLGCFVADQTLGFNYVRWVNDNHTETYIDERGIKFSNFKTVDKIENHIEWNSYIDILGHWAQRPNWKMLLSAYRLMNNEANISSDKIIWK